MKKIIALFLVLASVGFAKVLEPKHENFVSINLIQPFSGTITSVQGNKKDIAWKTGLGISHNMYLYPNIFLVSSFSFSCTLLKGDSFNYSTRFYSISPKLGLENITKVNRLISFFSGVGIGASLNTVVNVGFNYDENEPYEAYVEPYIGIKYKKVGLRLNYTKSTFSNIISINLSYKF